MTAHHPPASAAAAVADSDTNVFSISDAHLAQRYRFIREIGAGNWGCVWLCSPKPSETDEARAQAHGDEHEHERLTRRVAVKLVFREKKPNTAQRVRSLWNEMKIVRALRSDPHPSIIPFHSFIITPSFAIITMEYLPYLIPVEVPEPKAREWFHSLLSAVNFLHCRGVVHNDIKPANILLSTKRVPMFVDFGFAEKYELGAKRAFMSNLAYGTPEYLAPERARGHTHDTRKSDMWSLGITFFEILVGRTPFEYVEGEKFATPADLERYWARTVRGKWVGTWKMTMSAERLLRRMVCPNVEWRCTAAEAMIDPFWTADIEEDSVVSKESSLITMSSPVLGKTPGRVRKAGAKPLSPTDNGNLRSPGAKRSYVSDGKSRFVARPTKRVYAHALPTIEGSPISARTTAGRQNVPPASAHRSPRVAPVAKPRPPVKRKPVPAFDENASPFRTKIRDLAAQTPTKTKNRRSTVLTDTTSRMQNLCTPGRSASASALTSPVEKTPRRKGKETAKEKENDLLSPPEQPSGAEKGRQFGSGSYDRVKAFERLKQLERNRFLEEEEEDENEAHSENHQQPSLAREKPVQPAQNQSKPGHHQPECDNVQEVPVRAPDSLTIPSKSSMAMSQCMTSTSVGAFSTVTRVERSACACATPHSVTRAATARNFSTGRPRTADSSYTLTTDFKSTLVDRKLFEDVETPAQPKTILVDSLPISRHQASPSLFKNGFKASIDKTLGLYKLSIGRMNTRKPAERTAEELDGDSLHRDSWDDYSIISDVKTCLPVSRFPLHSQQEVAENKADRLSQWIRNVEQVVKETKENFASSSVTLPPPLPAPPASRAHIARVPRTQRKILPADQIFQEPEPISSPAPPKTSLGPGPALCLPSKVELAPSEPESPRSPSRRRATISSSGPSLLARSPDADSLGANGNGTPSRRKEKSRSAGNLSSLVRPISPLSQLQKALEKEEETRPRPNLSELLDRSIFIARPTGSTPPTDVHVDDAPPSRPPSPPRPRPQTPQIRLSTSLNPTKQKSSVASAVLRESTSSPVLFSSPPPQQKRESTHDQSTLSKATAQVVKRPRRIDKSQISSPTPVIQTPAAPIVPPATPAQKKTSRLFGSRHGRISHQQSHSEDLTVSQPLVRPVRPPTAASARGARSTDDFGLGLGLVPPMSFSHSSSFTKDASKSVNAVRKAFKAIVGGKSAARRHQQQQQLQQEQPPLQSTKVL